jgi:hypothetical protein
MSTNFTVLLTITKAPPVFISGERISLIVQAWTQPLPWLRGGYSYRKAALAQWEGARHRLSSLPSGTDK